MRGADWYDAIWLNVYHRAVATISAIDPDRAEAFVRRFDVLRTDPAFSTRYIPQAIDEDTLEKVRSVIRAVPLEKMEMHEMRDFGRFVVHDIPEFTELQRSMEERVSGWAGEPIRASYNFLSLYTHAGDCKPHLDAPSAKWTLDLCIDQSDGWPIHVSQVVPWPDVGNADRREGPLDYQSFTLQPGDAILFSGSSQWHYRDPLPRDGKKRHCDLLFMHFIPSGTEVLVQPRAWSSLFGIPELADVEGIDEAG